MASNLENSQRKLRALSCPRPKHSGMLHKNVNNIESILRAHKVFYHVMS